MARVHSRGPGRVGAVRVGSLVSSFVGLMSSGMPKPDDAACGGTTHQIRFPFHDMTSRGRYTYPSCKQSAQSTVECVFPLSGMPTPGSRLRDNNNICRHLLPPFSPCRGNSKGKNVLQYYRYIYFVGLQKGGKSGRFTGRINYHGSGRVGSGLGSTF